MSVEKNYYVIAGYDLTNSIVDEKYFHEEWIWSDEGENLLNNRAKGEIQLFNDPMSGEHLYLGYVLAKGDEYDFETSKFTIADIESAQYEVSNMLFGLVSAGLIVERSLGFKIIAFEECY